MKTHSRLGHEVGDMHEFAGVGVNERFVPRASLLVFNLNDVRKSKGAIALCDILESRGPFIVFATDEAFSLLDSSIEGDGRSGSGDAS